VTDVYTDILLSTFNLIVKAQSITKLKDKFKIPSKDAENMNWARVQAFSKAILATCYTSFFFMKTAEVSENNKPPNKLNTDIPTESMLHYSIRLFAINTTDFGEGKM